MKKFRDKEVIGWTIVVSSREKDLIDRLNNLMEQYDFIDCQYSTCSITNNVGGKLFPEYSALVLLGEKDEEN